jgi:putative ABC transport system permease protein
VNPVRALDRKLARDLWRIKGQAVAIALVVAGGIALFVLMLGTLQSLEVTRDAYYERYRFAQVFAQVKRAPEALAAEIRAIPGVQTVETRIVVDVTLDIETMAEPAIGRLVSLPEHDPPALNAVALRAGRMMAPGRTDEAVVSEAFAEAHDLAPGDALNAIINQRLQRFVIVGIGLSPEYVYSFGPGAFFPDDRTFGVLWVPRPTLAAAFDLEDAFNSVSLTLLRGASEAAVIEELDRLLERYGGLGAIGRADQTSNWFLENELEQLWTLALIAPPIFLAVAIFLLNIAVARLIETEREQIGLLKAFGYSDLAVGWHYAKFVLAMVLLGVLLGFALGAWLGRGMTELYAQFFRFPFLHYSPGPALFAIAALLALAAGLGGTWTAVRRAIRLPPAEAMRPASPPRYRRGLLERAGVARWITQPSRIILRHIARWPGRAALTTVGIGAGVAMLIGSMFSLGGIDHIIDVQFFQAQRQHASVSLVEPRPENALFEIRRLPGVMAAEPFRSVAVRLRSGPREERTAITGLDAETDIFRLLDADLRPLVVPPEGLMLARPIADRLGVGRGDVLIAEVLEGRRPTVEVRIAAVVEEYMGGSVVMERHALNRLMHEGTVISGAHLLVDRGREEELYAALKETPAVAGVALQTRMIETFRDHIAENLVVMIMINALFAAMIAFGVVYNSARIALSERARELASLRVLGFTRFEISYILLGELALLTLAALPLGCLMGYGLAALMASAFETELYRIPLVVERSTYGTAVLVVTIAAIVSGLVVRRRLDHLDLVAVLKTRE